MSTSIATMVGLVMLGMAGGAGLTLTLHSQTTVSCGLPIASAPLPWPTAERLPTTGGRTYR